MAESSTQDKLNATPTNAAETQNKADAGSGQSNTENLGDTGAASPSAGDDKKPDLESAVRAALNPEEKSSGSGDSGNDKATGSDKTAESGAEAQDDDDFSDLGDLSEEELSAYKPKTQRRMKQLLKQSEMLTNQLEEQRPVVEDFLRVRDFCNQAGLTKDDVNQGFEIMRSMKVDPHRAYEMITPIYRELEALVGAILPADLQEEVSAGRMSPERAQELSHLRSKTQVGEITSKQQQEREQQRQHAEQVGKLANDVGLAVSNWERNWKKSDPDYRLKSTRVMERIQLGLMQAAKANTMPKTTEEAVAFAEKIKKEIDEEYRKILPKRDPVQPVTGVGGNPDSRPAPKNTLEVVQQALGHK